MAKNPFKDSTKKTRRAAANVFLDLGVVRQVDADASHTVLVEILGTGGSAGPVVAAALVPQEGDINVPEKGSLVVVGRVKGRRPVILGSLYSTDSTVPSYNPGDRRIGHGSTQAQFLIEEDGTVRIDSESGQPVLINGAEPNTETDRTDVSDSGILVVSDVSDINFGSDLPVTDDGDGSVTVDVNRYTDAEAVAAVENEPSLTLTTQPLIVDPFGDASISSGRIAVFRGSDGGSNGWIEVQSDDAAMAGILFGNPIDGWVGRIHYNDSTGELNIRNTAGPVNVDDGPLQANGEQVVTESTGDEIFVARDTPTNINASNNLSWNTTAISDAPYSFDGTTVTIQEDGWYEISADADFTSGTARSNPNIGIRKNSASWEGVIGRSGYTRNADGHNHSSIHATATIQLVAGDTIHIRGIQESTSESIVPDRSQFYIKRLHR